MGVWVDEWLGVWVSVCCMFEISTGIVIVCMCGCSWVASLKSVLELFLSACVGASVLQG